MSSTTNPTGAHTVEGTTTSATRSDVERRGTHHPDQVKESKSGFKTSEFIVWVVASALVLIAGAVVDSGDQTGEGSFGIYRAFQIFGWITAAYIVSRGLAKIGVRHQDH